MKEDISLDNVISLLETSNILRIINENITIRKGPRGDYIFYKTKMMKKPKFFDIKQFSNDYINCQVEDIKTWITDTYKINL